MNTSKKKVLQEHSLIELNLKKALLVLDFIIDETWGKKRANELNIFFQASTAIALKSGQEYLFELINKWFPKKDFRISLRKPVYQKWKIIKEPKAAFELLELPEERNQFLSKETIQVLLWLEELEQEKYHHDRYKPNADYWQFQAAIQQIKGSNFWRNLKAPISEE